MRAPLTEYISGGLGAARVLARRSYARLSSSVFARDVSETLLTQLALLAVGFASYALVVRALGVAGSGHYAAALAVSAIGLQFGNLGLPSSNTYEVARSRSQLPLLLGNSLFVSFGLGIPLALAAAGLFLLKPGWVPIQGGLLLLALAWIPFGLAYMLLRNLLLGLSDVRGYNRIELYTKMAGLALVALAVGMKWISVEAFVLLALCALVLAFGASYLKVRRMSAGPPRLSWRIFRANLRYGLKAYLGGFFVSLLLQLDLLMVTGMLGAQEAGYYQLSVKMANYINMLPAIIGTLLFPKLSAMGDRRKKWAYTRKTALAVAGLMLVLTVLGGLLASPAIRLVLGESFLPAVPAFWWLMPGILMLAVNVVLMNYFASIGMPVVTVYSPLIAAFLNIIINLAFIPRYGILGASMAASICYGVMLLLSAAYILFFQPKEKRA